MTSPTPLKKRLIFLFIFAVLFVILIPIVVLYSTGYRLDKNLNLESTGGIYVYYPTPGIYVSVDGMSPEQTSIFDKSVFIQDLKPGTYHVTVSKDGYTQWQKNMIVLQKRVAEGYPFLILNPVATTSILDEDLPAVESLFSATGTVYSAATTTLASSSLVETVSPPISPLPSNSLSIGTSSVISSATGTLIFALNNRNIYLYLEGNSLKALWEGQSQDTPFYFCNETTLACGTEVTATVSESPIKHFDFFPGRDDVVVYSNKDGVFVTELDTRETHNFATLATGTVDFRIESGHIYIQEKEGKTVSYYEVIYE